MDLGFTPEQAARVIEIVSPFIVVWLTKFLSKYNGRSEYKMLLVVIISITLGALQTYAENKLGTNLVENIIQILGFSQIVYQGYSALFKPYLEPHAELVKTIKDTVRRDIDKLSTETVQAVLDPTKPVALTVKTDIVELAKQDSETKITEIKYIGAKE